MCDRSVPRPLIQTIPAAAVEVYFGKRQQQHRFWFVYSFLKKKKRGDENKTLKHWSEWKNLLLVQFTTNRSGRSGRQIEMHDTKTTGGGREGDKEVEQWRKRGGRRKETKWLQKEEISVKFQLINDVISI